MIPEYVEMRRQLAADHDHPDPMPRQVLDTRCPHCGVRPGAHCVLRGTEVRLRHTQAHPSRWIAAGFEVPAPRVPAGLLSREHGGPGVPGTPGDSEGSQGRMARAS